MIIPRSNNPPSATLPDGSLTRLWWDAPKTDVAKMVFATAKYLSDKQATRRAASLHHLRVYSNRMATSLSGSAFAAGQESGERIKMNATKSAADAVTAQIASNAPGVMHLTGGGSYERRQRAARLDRYDLGWFTQLQLHTIALEVFLDAVIDGTGILKFIAHQSGKIGCERTRPEELLWDDNECKVVIPGVTPRFMFHARPIARSVITKNPLFSRHKEEIKASEFLEFQRAGFPAIDEQCTIIEAWKRPAFGVKGRHVICLSNLVLLDEEWDFQELPFAFFRWNTAPIGFAGIGLVEEVLPLQIELNYLCQKIQRLLHFATSAVFKEKGADMQKITNEDWAVYEHTGKRPEFVNMQAASAEYYAQADRLYQRIYEIAGVSQMAATGAKPPGLYSGEAIRLFHDVATRRYQHTEKRWEQFFVDCAYQIEDRAREIVKRGYGTAQTLSHGDREVEQLNWSDVEMERDMFVMRTRPVSIIPQEPAGKVELIKSLAPAVPGLAPYLLGTISGIPDLEAAVQRANAPHNYAEQLVSNIIEHGIYEPPSAHSDKNAVFDIANRDLLRAKALGISPANTALLRRLVFETDAMIQEEKMEALQQAMMMQGGLGGPPGMGGAPQQPPATNSPPGMDQGALGALFGASARQAQQ